MIIENVPAEACANYHLKDMSCGQCGYPSLDYAPPVVDRKNICGFAKEGFHYPKRKNI